MEKDKEGNLFDRKNQSGPGKDIIKTFIEKPEMTEKLITLTGSSFAAYKKPRNLFENLANILTVAMAERWGSDGVYQKYREWTSKDYPLQEIAEYLDRATRMDKATRRISPPEKKTQTLITEYFPCESDPDNVPGNTADLENNQRKPEDQEKSKL